MFRPTKILPSALTVLLALCAAGEAHAVDLAGGSFRVVLQKLNSAGDDYIDMSAQDADEFFNISNCMCGVNFAIEVSVEGTNATLDSSPVEIWVGTNCDDTTDDTGTPREQRCTLIDTVPDINTLKTRTTIEILTAELMQPGTIAQNPLGAPYYGCFQVEQEVTRNIYLLVDDNSDLEYENVHYLDPDLFADTQRPPLAEDPTVSRGEGGALLQWTVPESNTDDLRSYQVLCERTDGTFDPADGFPRADAAYMNPLFECPELFPELSAPLAPPPGPLLPDGGPVDGGVPDGGPGAPDAGTEPPGTPAQLLDPMFICSGEIGATESEHRVSGLANGVEYRIILVSIDPRLNPYGIELGTITPSAVSDFWEDYKDRGGTADGEYCFVATATYGDYDHPFVRVLRDFRDDVLATSHFGRRLIRSYYDNSPGLASFIAKHWLLRAIAWVLLLPLVLIAGVWVYTGLLGKLALIAAFALWRVYRRRRKAHAEPPPPPPRKRLARAAAVATGILVLVAISQSASAQPYWDEPGGPADQAMEKEVEARRSQWVFELKFGPYLPDIDGEFDLAEGEQGPYAEMYGGSKLMTQIEVDRFFLYPEGQLGIGLGLGMFNANANAFEIDADGNVAVDPDTMEPIRSEGDETKLRIMPVSLSAVYRLTALDDRWHIPLVPYGKIGLSWYVWRITRPDGKRASVPTDPSCVTDCDLNIARGATTGWQASVGLSIRAERIDARAAKSLQQEMGIEHAGFFAEMTYAKVDGITGGNRLHLGDTTWFAGINFEF